PVDSSSPPRAATGPFETMPSPYQPCPGRSCPCQIAEDPTRSDRRAQLFRLSMPVSVFHSKAPRILSTRLLFVRGRAQSGPRFRAHLRDTDSDFSLQRPADKCRRLRPCDRALRDSALRNNGWKAQMTSLLISWLTGGYGAGRP